MKLRTMLILSIAAFAALFAGFFALSSRHRGAPAGSIVSAPLWQRMAAPGELSKAHSFLDNKCAACHTPVKGVEAKNCIVCHAGNKAVLQRQPSAFHADIGACAGCHPEHQGRAGNTTKMDHSALARTGLKQLKNEPQPAGADLAQLKRWLEQTGDTSSPQPAHLEPMEGRLNCATCHQTKDRHHGFFGSDCGQCHGTNKWTLPEFRHPPPGSQSCAQCHQAPPSHYMMHFQMISMKVARVERAEVSQCFLCHQTTSWNDIKGVGYYKHH